MKRTYQLVPGCDAEVCDWASAESYRLESQLHERRVVKLSDLSPCPVMSRRSGIDGISQGAGVRFRWWRRGGGRG